MNDSHIAQPSSTGKKTTEVWGKNTKMKVGLLIVFGGFIFAIPSIAVLALGIQDIVADHLHHNGLVAGCVMIFCTLIVFLIGFLLIRSGKKDYQMELEMVATELRSRMKAKQAGRNGDPGWRVLTYAMGGVSDSIHPIQSGVSNDIVEALEKEVKCSEALATVCRLQVASSKKDASLLHLLDRAYDSRKALRVRKVLVSRSRLLEQSLEAGDTHVEALQEACPGCKIARVSSLSNWGQTQTMQDIIEVKPQTIEQLSDVIRTSRQLGLTLRVIGSRHSWSPLFPDPSNVALDLSGLECHDGPNIELVSINGTRAIRAMTGQTIENLIHFEMKSKHSPETSTLFSAPSIGGVYATGSHGAATQLGPMGDSLLEMRLVDSKGNLRKYSKTDDPEVFSALGTNLGLAGVMYDVTFAVQPRKVFRRRHIFKKVSALTPEYLKQLTSTSHSVHFFWFPYNSVEWDTALRIWAFGWVQPADWNPDVDDVWIVQVTEDSNGGVPKDEKPAHVPSLFDILGALVLDGTDEYVGDHPNVTPFIMGRYVAILKGTFGNKSYVEYTPNSTHWRPLAEAVPMLETEWLFPTDPNHLQTYQTLQYIKSELKTAFDKEQFPVNMVIEFRFMQPSKQMMNPAVVGRRGQYMTGMGVMSVLNTEGYNDFADRYAAYVRDNQGALPHWGKMWSGGKATVDKLKAAYNYKGFAAAMRKADLDPVPFSNTTLRDIFGI